MSSYFRYPDTKQFYRLVSDLFCGKTENSEVDRIQGSLEAFLQKAFAFETAQLTSYFSPVTDAVEQDALLSGQLSPEL